MASQQGFFGPGHIDRSRHCDGPTDKRALDEDAHCNWESRTQLIFQSLARLRNFLCNNHTIRLRLALGLRAGLDCKSRNLLGPGAFETESIPCQRLNACINRGAGILGRTAHNLTRILLAKETRSHGTCVNLVKGAHEGIGDTGAKRTLIKNGGHARIHKWQKLASSVSRFLSRNGARLKCSGSQLVLGFIRCKMHRHIESIAKRWIFIHKAQGQKNCETND